VSLAWVISLSLYSASEASAAAISSFKLAIPAASARVYSPLSKRKVIAEEGEVQPDHKKKEKEKKEKKRRLKQQNLNGVLWENRHDEREEEGEGRGGGKEEEEEEEEENFENFENFHVRAVPSPFLI